MRRKWHALLLVLFGLCAAVLLAASVQRAAAEDASSYPSRVVRIVVPFAPGGPNDILARLIAEELAVRWKASIIVDNRPGGGTIIGTQAAATSAPDGYTLLMVSLSTATNVSLKKSLPYDTVKGFTPIIGLAEAPIVLVVTPKSAIHSIADLIALAKASPGKLSYGTAGTGTATDLGSYLLCASAGVDMVRVPYKGDAPALLDLLGGRLDWMFGTILSVMPHVQGGTLQPVAIGSARRTDALPGIPTVAETLPGFAATSWYGMFAPAGTPPAIVAKLNSEIGTILKTEKVSAFFKSQGTTALGGDPAAFRVFFDSEVEKWAKVIKQAGIEAQ